MSQQDFNKLVTGYAGGLDGFIKRATGINRQQAIVDGKCAICLSVLGEFKDELSKREAQISQTCQKCQDGIFDGS